MYQGSFAQYSSEGDRFENNYNVNESSEELSQDSDNEFHSQCVQGTKPRNFAGLSKDLNVEQMLVGDKNTTIDLHRDKHDSDMQHSTNKDISDKEGGGA